MSYAIRVPSFDVAVRRVVAAGFWVAAGGAGFCVAAGGAGAAGAGFSVGAAGAAGAAWGLLPGGLDVAHALAMSAREMQTTVVKPRAVATVWRVMSCLRASRYELCRG